MKKVDQGRPFRERSIEERMAIMEQEKMFVFGQLGSYMSTMMSFGLPAHRLRHWVLEQCLANDMVRNCMIDFVQCNCAGQLVI